MGHVTVAGTDLYYERVGSGEPLLLIMGMGGTTQLWGDEFVGPLAEHYEVITYDHRGAGRSGRVTDAFTTADLADDAIALLSALEIDAVHLLGISMGGMVAQELALRASDRVRSLILGCTWAGGASVIFPSQTDLEEFVAISQVRDPQELLQRSFAINTSDAYAADPAHLATFMQRSMRHPTPRATTALQMQAVGTHDTGERLATLDRPTLVVHGTADRVIPAANGEFLAGAIPNATRVSFADVGHLFWSERPLETVTAVVSHTCAANAG